MHKIIEQAMGKYDNLLEPDAMKLFSDYGIATPKCKLTRNVEEAANYAAIIGYPVTLKISSHDIIHKSDVGGVIPGIKTENDLRNAFSQILSNVAKHAPNAIISGINVMENADTGIECIVGMNKDDQFGNVIMFGLGGIFVEVLKDVSLQLMPISREEAYDMIGQIKGAKLLTGHRGSAPKDTDAIADLILQVSKMVMENPEIKELDINPVFVYEDGLKVVDARVLI